METDEKERPSPAVLKLFVSGSMPGGRRALENLLRSRDVLGTVGYSIEVVDSLERPGEADAAGIMVMPTLSDESAVPVRRLVCDLSDIAWVVEFFSGSGKIRKS